MEFSLFGRTFEIRRASKKELAGVTANTFGSTAFLYSREKPMLLSAVYRCVEVKSNDVGSLPLKIYERMPNGFKREAFDHPLHQLLNLEPNENMSRFTFFKTLQASVDLAGNAFAYVERASNGDVVQLHYIPSREVDVVFQPDGYGIKRKYYRINNVKKLVHPQDMIHILNFSYDGILGVSTLTHAAQAINISTSAEEHALGFFKSGGSLSGILSIEHSTLTNGQKDQIYADFNNRIHPTDGYANGVAILEKNMRFQPIGVSAKDAQMLESRAYDVISICRFFGVSPIKAFDLSKSSYATVEAMQLQHLSDTLAPLVANFEDELNRKLLLPNERKRFVIEFDTTHLLRTDKAAEAQYLNTMFNIGAITINEIRRKNNLPDLPDGDTPFVPVNLQTLGAATNPPQPPQEVEPSPTDKPVPQVIGSPIKDNQNGTEQ